MELDRNGNNSYLNNCFTISSQNINSLDEICIVEVADNNENGNGRTRNCFRHSCYHLRELLGKVPQRCPTVFLVHPLVMISVWGVIFSIFGKTEAYPGGSLFSLFVLVNVSIVLGTIAPLLGCAPAFGMLSAGLLLANVPDFSPARHLRTDHYEPLRALAVVVLLARGALAINVQTIRRLGQVVPLLGFTPFLTEAAIYAVLAVLLLEMPVAWAAMVGFIIATMSGSIVTPCITHIEGRIGGGHDVSAVAKAACGLDAIVGICLAKCCMGFIVARGHVWAGLQMGVLEVAIGGTFGVIWGVIVGLVVSPSTNTETRTFVAFAGGATSMLGLSKLNHSRGGPAGAFLGTLIVANLWRWRHLDGANNEKLQEHFTKLWFLFEPVLFGLIGYRTDLCLVDWCFIFKCVICLAVSLTVRVLAAALTTSCVKWSWRQRLFIMLAWIPKGTVQAALGTVALDTVTHQALGNVSIDLGIKILHLSVLTAFVTSSFGHLFLTLLGTRLLKVE